MFLLKKGVDLSTLIQNQRQQEISIGFVPTMGALHEGHLSLLERSRSDKHFTICSIFVNPTQFTNADDLKNYPRTLESDIQLLSESGFCDAVFIPSTEEMYPDGTTISETLPLGNLENLFEGKYRPRHFQGVAGIVGKLLNLVRPDYLYMGQKDYQQCLVIQKLIALKKIPVQLITCPIRRESDGLAMSSRNRRLTPTQRTLAGLLYQCLVSIQAQQEHKDFVTVEKECVDLLQQKGIQPDYVAIANADTLEPMDNYDGSKKMIALIAGTVGGIRLIDNLML
ncbi:MAG TPA: pantoate--beta-alanine ligase [Edaphocola sp.]|nr:pantoate--beta-alanine ligase [Edaphocola sp.]